MNTEQQPETKKTTDRWLRAMGHLCWITVLGAWIFGVHKQNISNKAPYIVTDKMAQKIYYAPIKAQYDIHVMQCDTFDLDSMLYNAVNVGDTILGRKIALDDTNSHASYADMYNMYRLSNILYVNGKSLTQLNDTNRIAQIRKLMIKQNVAQHR